MNIKLILNLFITELVFGGLYEVGDSVSNVHQEIPYPVCHGEYPTDNLQLSQFNGEINGGNYKIIWIEMLATW
tara:strand:+ start:131 stop:349 length:219 start_codon:yes stop_codon:yes gene_type:complete